MFSSFGFGLGYWWIFPIIMIALMAVCFFMMRGMMTGHRRSMMCGMGGGSSDTLREKESVRVSDKEKK